LAKQLTVFIPLGTAIRLVLALLFELHAPHSAESFFTLDTFFFAGLEYFFVFHT
jgi:hypothetical protein